MECMNFKRPEFTITNDLKLLWEEYKMTSDLFCKDSYAWVKEDKILVWMYIRKIWTRYENS